MRIIGGHDYYDSVLAYGSDSSVVFVRDKTLEQTKLYGVFEPPNTNVVAKTQRGDIHYLDRMHSYQQKNFDFTMCRVIVAGAQWNGVRYNSHAYNHPTTTKYIWDWQNFLEILDQEKYSTNGEELIIIKNVDFSEIILDSNRNHTITIKTLTNCVIKPDVNKIDEDWDEIELKRGSCVQFHFADDTWYILSSDGIKID